MKTITIKIESDRDADLLKSILKTTKFESEVQTIEEDDEFTDEEFQMLEERWEKYQKNPSSAISFEEFNERLRKKYGESK
jgi:putative addiction module component (TIGR02574 family)